MLRRTCLWTLCAMLCLAGLFLEAAHAAVPQGEWVATGSPPHTGTVLVALPDGSALQFGASGVVGRADVVDRYHPDTGTWTTDGTLQILRPEVATLLPSGLILLSGGQDGTNGGFQTQAVELYDPTTATSTLTGPMNFIRTGHRATLLPSGKVLVSGGTDQDDVFVGPAELYDPATGTWSLTGTLNQRRRNHAAVLLQDGRVLVAGGNGIFNPIVTPFITAETYDPTAETWTFAASMDRPRSFLTGVPLADGRIIVAGLLDPTSQVYDPESNTWAPGVDLGFRRSDGLPLPASDLVVLHDGTPLAVRAGVPFTGPCFPVCTTAAPQAALFDVDAEKWARAAPQDVGLGPLVVLADGRVLLASGQLFVPSDVIPGLIVSPPAVAFETRSPAVPAQQTVTLQNAGGATLTVTATTSAPFSIVSGSPFTIAAATSTQVTVQFTPPGIGTFSGALQFTSGGKTLSVRMTAQVGQCPRRDSRCNGEE